jgi:hypothetical protein
MRHIFVSLLIFLSVSAISAQTHRQALDEFEQLKQKAEEIKRQSEDVQRVILQPDTSDIIAAEKENANVFRLLPREKYDKDVFKLRGGGAFYSFTKQSHSYDDIPQISLEQNYLQVGFYGASYGFMTDLGEIPLSKINESANEAAFFVKYAPPAKLSEARVEQIRTRNLEDGTQIIKNRLPAKIGNTYLLRAISYNEADTLVALRIFRKDFDGSLIIFWKEIKIFEKPNLIRDDLNYSVGNVKFESDKASSESLAAKIEAELREKGFTDVKVSEDEKMIILRGSVPRGKMADVVRLAQEIGKRPVKNELTEKD